MTTAQAVIFLALCFVPVTLTLAMFITRERMLGFPSGIMWAVLGGYSWTLSTVTWDIYYLMGFASLLGMVVFTILSAFALREKRDTIADKELEKGEGAYIDETKEEIPGQEPVSKRTKGIRARANARRSKLGGD